MTTKELVTFDNINPVKVFVPNGLEPLLTKYEAQMKSIHLDPTTEAGRENIRSVAFKVSKDKNLVDKLGKELGSEYRKKIDEINGERNRGVDRLQTLQDNIRAPLTEFENKEKARVAAHEEHLKKMEEQVVFNAAMPTTVELESRIRATDAIYDRDWQEFNERAFIVHETTTSILKQALEKTKAFDKEQAEIAEFKKNEAIRLQKERDDKIKAEAADNARKEAEATQKKKEEKLADDLRKEREKTAKLEQDRKDAAEKAKRDKERAVQAEKDRAAAEKAREDEATAKREANKRHKAKINNEALAGLMAVVDKVTEEKIKSPTDAMKLIVEAIAKGEIPHVVINY